MTKLEAALSYAQRGWYVFPVNPGGKAPLGRLAPNGFQNATLNAATITEWWTEAPNANIGVALEASGLAVLDIEAQGLKQALAMPDVAALNTLTARSGGGGLHLVFYRGDHPAGKKPRWRDEPIDVLANGYILVEPSVSEKGAYRWLDQNATIEAFPEFLANAYTGREPREKPDAPRVRAEPPDAPIELLAHVKERLAALGPAVEGEGGDNHTYKACCIACWSFDLNTSDAFRVLAEWNQTNQPPWSEDELRVKMRNAESYAVGERGDMRLRWELLHREPEEVKPTDDTYISELFRRIEFYSNRKPIPTGFDQLDKRLGGGLEPGTLTLCVAPVGGGKTSFACQTLWNHAEKGLSVFYSGEMLAEQTAARFISIGMGVPWTNVLRGGVSRKDMEKVCKDRKLWVLDESENPIRAIAKKIEWLRMDCPDKPILLAIDYVQLLAAVSRDIRTDNARAVRELLTLTKNAAVMTLALSQASRGSADKIRAGGGSVDEFATVGAETAELERAAANVLVLSFEREENLSTHQATVVVAKSRFGSPGRVGFEFEAPSGRWTELACLPRTKAELEAEAGVLEEVTKHSQPNCPCLAALKKSHLWTSGKHHRVGGKDKYVQNAVARLISYGDIIDDPERGLMLTRIGGL